VRPRHAPQNCTKIVQKAASGSAIVQKALAASNKPTPSPGYLEDMVANIPCSEDATQLMADVQSDLSRFADNPDTFLAAQFQPGPIEKGRRLSIIAGLPNIPEGVVPVKPTA